MVYFFVAPKKRKKGTNRRGQTLTLTRAHLFVWYQLTILKLGISPLMQMKVLAPVFVHVQQYARPPY